MRSAVAERVPQEPARAALDVRAGTARWWSLSVVVVLVLGVAVWVTAPRFALDLPSLVDDWAAISRSPEQMSDVVRFTNPEEQRFRPGWVLWNYVQWHTFDAPRGIVGPNVWNVARMLVLVAGLCLLTALALPRPRGALEAAVYAALAGLPALLVVTVPKFGRDIARFGTQEPLLIGGMALGGSLLVLLVSALLDVRSVTWWRTVLLGVLGSGFWIVGVYQKETSVCVVPLLAAALYAGRGRLTRWRRLSKGRRALLSAVAAVVVLPLVHVAVESVRIAARGDLIYDAEVAGGRGAAMGVRYLLEWADEVFSPDATLVIIGAVAFTVLATLIRRRIDALAVAALAAGALTFVFAGQSGAVVSRYYLPLYALFAVALSLSLARLPRIFQLAAIAWIALTFVPSPGLRDEVTVWADEERQKEELVRLVTDLESSGCPVAVGGLDLETGEALPVLVGLHRHPSSQPCEAGTYLVVRLGGEGIPLVRACAAGALEPVLEQFTANVYRCARLREKPVRDPTFGLVEPERLVALRRLRPVAPT